MVNLTGQVIRDYELKSLIGVGGFGEVYQAYQRSIKRDVAVKIILPDHLQQREFVRRFQVEAETVAGLEHAYIVPLYDFWTDASGAYLVMRLYRGGSLQESIRADGPWDPLRALRMVEQVGSALHYAHKRSIVHQDIKAANVLLDEEQNCYLTDFGIAKTCCAPLLKTSSSMMNRGKKWCTGHRSIWPLNRSCALAWMRAPTFTASAWCSMNC